MKLTPKHLQELYKFTRQHYVEYYDVQTELVDHLANDIEQIWEENPKLSFEQARDKSFKKFGIFGFMDVVDAKKSQMIKKYFNIIIKFAKEWFRLPKIILTTLLFLGFYTLQNVAEAFTMYSIIFFSIFTVSVFKMIYQSIQFKKKQKITQKKWLFEQVLQTQGFGSFSLFLYYMYLFFLPDSTKEFLAMGDFRRALSALLITFLVIFTYITLVVIPKKAEQLLQETYPEYKFV